MKMGILHSFEKSFLFLLLLFSAVNNLNAQNILTNGDFESGGSGVGFFVHDYTLINPLTGVSTPELMPEQPTLL